jgi:hypothetical protein
MSEQKFTFGPWQTMPEETDKQYVRIRGTQLGERYKIANVLTPDYEGANELEADETRANARLIAAAPELLEALRDMLSGWKYIREVHGDLYGVGWDRAQEKAESAIAKATGAA